MYYPHDHWTDCSELCLLMRWCTIDRGNFVKEKERLHYSNTDIFIFVSYLPSLHTIRLHSPLILPPTTHTHQIVFFVSFHSYFNGCIIDLLAGGFLFGNPCYGTLRFFLVFAVRTDGSGSLHMQLFPFINVPPQYASVGLKLWDPSVYAMCGLQGPQTAEHTCSCFFTTLSVLGIAVSFFWCILTSYCHNL